MQSIAYWTIIGRLDQFALGMFFFQIRRHVEGRGRWVAASCIAFLVFWYAFDLNGGFYRSPSYPSPSPVWIVLTSIEGLAYAILIAWYDATTASRSEAWPARFIALIGTYSYSLYLLHFFVVFKMPALVDRYVVDLSNPYVRLLAAVPCFLALLPVAYLSYRFVEAPFLKYRRPYVT